MRFHYIVSYDIADPTRLRRVHKAVRDFGDGVQLSVFACQITEHDRAVLESKLLDITNQREDQVIFIKLGLVAEAQDAPPRCHSQAREVSIMPPKPPRPTTQEIHRDEELVSCDLLRNLGRLLLDTLDALLLGGPQLDVRALHTEVAHILSDSDGHLRRLNDARINRRGRAPTRTADAEPVPESARPFARQGSYLGSYASLQALAADALALGALVHPELARLDLTGVGLDLHLHGIVWTIMADGSLHAFRPPPEE
ncbi:MAG TPA: CRISPR-associated endonuclease Cas2 [Nannocystis sp.]|jgi:CRISPR-associated protein Cas2